MPWVKEAEERYRFDFGDGRSLHLSLGASASGERQHVAELSLGDARIVSAKYEPKTHVLILEPAGSRAILDLEGKLDWQNLPDVQYMGMLGILQANALASPKKDENE